MEKTILILLLAIGGTMANQPFGDFCDIEKCKPELQDRLDDPLELDAGELLKFCPSILKSIKCINIVITFCTGTQPIQLVESEDESIAAAALIFTGADNVFTDLCDDGSDLNRGFKNGFECLKEKIDDIAEECISHGQKVYLEFKQPVLELLDGDDELEEELDDEGECLVMGYAIACATTKLRFDCSSETAETFSQIVKRSNIVKATACSPKDLQTLKTDFVDYLETQGGNRDVLSAAFDFRKKK